MDVGLTDMECWSMFQRRISHKTFWKLWKDKRVNLVYLRKIFRTFLSDIPSQIVKHTMMPDKSQDKPIIKLKQNANELSRL